MKKAVNFILGAILGGLVGGSIVLLLAPGSGSETQTAIQDRFSALRAELKKAIAEKKAALELELREYKKPDQG